MRRNGPCSLAWCAASAGNLRNNTIILSNCQRPLCFRPARNCEHIRNVWLASSGTVIAAWNRVRLVNARRGAGLLDFEGSGLPISFATWPASAVREWLGMGRLVPALAWYFRVGREYKEQYNNHIHSSTFPIFLPSKKL